MDKIDTIINRTLWITFIILFISISYYLYNNNEKDKIIEKMEKNFLDKEYNLLKKNLEDRKRKNFIEYEKFEKIQNRLTKKEIEEYEKYFYDEHEDIWNEESNLNMYYEIYYENKYLEENKHLEQF